MKVAVYARVSTNEQTVENQLRELRGYCEARGLLATEYVDSGVSGATESRPALDVLLKDARRRKFSLLVVWKLDRLGRSLRHLILTLDELTALGVGARVRSPRPSIPPPPQAASKCRSSAPWRSSSAA